AVARLAGWTGPVTWPQPAREAHEKFCAADGWQRVRDARGRAGTHHVTYEPTLPDGPALRTRISHQADRSHSVPSLWGHILRDQLHVSAEEFWNCVQHGVVPDRGVPKPPSTALPAELVHLLISRVGLPETEVAAMTKEEAVSRLQRYWTEG